MRKIMEPAREIPVVLEGEVVVVGGGPAGIAAAAANCIAQPQMLWTKHSCMPTGTDANANAISGAFGLRASMLPPASTTYRIAGLFTALKKPM